MSNNLLKNISKNTASLLHAYIGNTFIIEYGIIKKIPAKGIVTVEMSVTDKAENIIITNCVYANLASSSFSMNMKPNIDDKVLVLFPRKFMGAMFKAENNEPLISECSNGYTVMGGIAIPLNQYQEVAHKNFIYLSDGNLMLKLAYDEENERNLFSLTTSSDGSLSLSLGYNEDEDKGMAELSAQADGNITLSNAVTTVTIGDDGAYSIDNGKSTVSVDKDGNVSIDAKDGKVTIKNSSANLFTILKGMLQILNSSLATAGSPANHTVVPNQFSQQDTQLGQLMQ